VRLRDHLRTDLVLAGLEATDRASVLTRVADFVAAADPRIDAETLRAALEARESAHTTCMGDGLALPHARLEALDRTVLGLAVSTAPVDFGGPEDDPVRLFFLLLSPRGEEGTHIRLLARICRLVRMEGVATDLLEAASAEELAGALLQHDEVFP